MNEAGAGQKVYQDTELEYWLENPSGDGPGIFQVLVERYASQICWLIDNLLQRKNAPSPAKEQIFSIVQRVFKGLEFSPLPLLEAECTSGAYPQASCCQRCWANPIFKRSAWISHRMEEP